MTITNEERIAEQKQFEEKYKDLAIFNPDALMTPERMKKCVDDLRREHENEKNCTMLFDPTDEKRRDYQTCKRRYGADMADKMYRAKKENNGRLEGKDYAELMNNRNQKAIPSKSEKKAVSKPNPKAKTDPFIRLEHRILQSDKVRRVLKKSLQIYLYLRTCIVREKFKGDKLNLYETYFKKGKLAATVSIRKLARDWHMDEKTVGTYLKEMAEHGVIKIRKVSAADAYDNQQHNVYILGTHDFNKNEHYFVEQLATSDE